MIAGLATQIAVNDHYILATGNGFAGPWEARQPPTVLRKRDEVGEILAPRVFGAIGQHDYAFWR